LRLPFRCGADHGSSLQGFDLSGDVPDEATQLARDGHADLVLWQFASHTQVSEALGQTQLCMPGDVTNRLGLALLAYFQATADAGAMAIGPGRFDQDTSGVFVTALVMLPCRRLLPEENSEGTRPR